MIKERLFYYSIMLVIMKCEFLTATVISILQKSIPNAKIGFSKAMSGGWLRIDKQAEGGPRVFRKVS